MLSTSSRENNYREETLLTDEISSSIKDGKIRGYECLSCASRGMEVQAYCGKCGSPQLKTIDLDTFGRIITYTIQRLLNGYYMVVGVYVNYLHLRLSDNMRHYSCDRVMKWYV